MATTGAIHTKHDDEQVIRALVDRWLEATTVVRSGYTLTILRKQTDGNWVIARDANLVT